MLNRVRQPLIYMCSSPFRYSQLNIVEKVILSIVQFMLSNKFARIFVFIYSILLHALVSFQLSLKPGFTPIDRWRLCIEVQIKYQLSVIQHGQARAVFSTENICVYFRFNIFPGLSNVCRPSPPFWCETVVPNLKSIGLSTKTRVPISLK